MTDQDDDRAARGDTDGGVASTRLCVGCRRDEARDDLLRFALSPDAPYLSPDPMRRLGGRGVSVHATRACITAAVRKGGFAKALRQSVSLDASALCAAASFMYEQRASSLVLAASRRKKLAIGTDAVREALRAGVVEVLLVAADAEGRRSELEGAAARLDRRCAVMGTKQSLGRLFGRDEVGVLGILDRRMGDEVVRCAAHVADLAEVE